jgi:hypothetical protein
MTCTNMRQDCSFVNDEHTIVYHRWIGRHGWKPSSIDIDNEETVGDTNERLDESDKVTHEIPHEY